MSTLLSRSALLFHAVAALGAQVVSEAPEPNAAVATASTIVCGYEGHGTLSGVGDSDLWSFVLSGPSDVAVFVTSRGAVPWSAGGSSAEDTRCVLFASDGSTRITSNDDYSERPFAQRGYFSKLTADGLAAGTYYVEVTGRTAIDQGDYALDIVCSAAANLAFCASFRSAAELEPNDVPVDANPTASCEHVRGSVGSSGDEDWFALTLAGDARARFEVVPALTFTPLVDSQCWLYESDGSTLIAWDDDGGVGLAARLDLALRAGSYLVKVRGFGSDFGDYELRVDSAALAAGLPTLGDWRVDGVGCVGTSGAPLTIVPRLNEWPMSGQTFGSDLSGVPAGVAAMFMGLFGFAQPLDLGVIGASGCSLLVNPVVSFPLSGSAPDEAALSIPVLDDPRQAGVRIMVQAVAIDPGANLLGLTSSNLLTLVVGVDG